MFFTNYKYPAPQRAGCALPPLGMLSSKEFPSDSFPATFSRGRLVTGGPLRVILPGTPPPTFGSLSSRGALAPPRFCPTCYPRSWPLSLCRAFFSHPPPPRDVVTVATVVVSNLCSGFPNRGKKVCHWPSWFQAKQNNPLGGTPATMRPRPTPTQAKRRSNRTRARRGAMVREEANEMGNSCTL